jgi:nucleotide-binding universal stress UspA family protein
MRSPRVSAGEARRELERLAGAAAVAAAAAGNRDVDAVSLVSEGWPAIEIVRAAWQERSELVVVGPPAARFDGSTRATIFRVMRRADLPLLVTREEPSRDYRRVLCAVDRSVAAVDTIALAARIAGPVARSFALLHVYQVPFEQWVGPDAPDLEAEAQTHVRALARAVADDVTVTATVVRRGECGTQIMRAATEQRADLIVIGTHGRSGVSRAVVGSTAEWVIASAPCDVAVARPHRFSPERHQ